MINILSRHGKEYYPREPDRNTYIRKLYDTLQMCYTTSTGVTLNDIKNKDLMEALPRLEEICLIEPKREDILTNNGITMRVKSYNLTNKGIDFFQSVEQHNKDYNYKTFEEIKEDFMLSLELEDKKVLNQEIIEYRKHLKQIQIEHDKRPWIVKKFYQLQSFFNNQRF